MQGAAAEVLVVPLFLIVLSVLAGTCPDLRGAVRDGAIAPDGSGWLLVADDALVCWWVVDDNGDERVAARWSRFGARYPVAVEALADGSALLLMVEDDGGWHLLVVGEDGRRRELGVGLPAIPTRMLAHPDLPLVAFRVTEPAGRARVVLADVRTGRTLASVVVGPERERMSFRAGDPRLYVDGVPPLAIGAAGTEVLSDAR